MITFTIHKSLDAASGRMALDVSCGIQKGAFVTVFGPSGAGKTTLLRILAGLLTPEKGYIEAGGEIWLDTEKKINIPPQKRGIGFVFQDYALFPNMTVRGNLEYALGKGQEKKTVDELAGIMELGQLMGRHPATLSGGQKQRVALARALVCKPQLLLLDEPLSALGHEMRFHIQDYILKAHRAYGLTTILVSHDISEIYKMSDEIFVLENGQVIRHGRPQELFSNRQASNKFQVMGEVLAIEKEDIIYVVTILVNNNVVKVVATHEEVQPLKPGAPVIVSAKAFNLACMAALSDL